MIERLRSIAGKVCRGEATAEEERFVVASFEKAFHKPFSRCKCQLCDAIFLILKNTDKMETKYKLKKGIVLTNFGMGYRLTYLNVTDKLAERHLKDKPQDAIYFDVIPAKEPPVKVEEPELATEIKIEPEVEKAIEVTEPVKKKPVRRKRKR